MNNGGEVRVQGADSMLVLMNGFSADDVGGKVTVTVNLALFGEFMK